MRTIGLLLAGMFLGVALLGLVDIMHIAWLALWREDAKPADVDRPSAARDPRL